MVQNGFAIFFLLVLASGIVFLLHAGREMLGTVAAALLAEPLPEPRPRPVRVDRRRTADVPRIARRLASACSVDTRPSTGEVRIWAYCRSDPAA